MASAFCAHNGISKSIKTNQELRDGKKTTISQGIIWKVGQLVQSEFLTEEYIDAVLSSSFVCILSGSVLAFLWDFRFTFLYQMEIAVFVTFIPSFTGLFRKIFLWSVQNIFNTSISSKSLFFMLHWTAVNIFCYSKHI